MNKKNISKEEVNKKEKLLIELLVKIRKEKKLSQEKVAKLSGLTQQSISRLETLNTKPNLSNLIKYMYALDLDLEECILHFHKS